MSRKIVDKLSLVTLMGLPGSGKSYLADTIKASFEDCSETLCVILRYDDFVPLQIQQRKEYLGNSQLCKILRKNFVQSVQWLASSMLNADDNILDLSATLSPDANDLLQMEDFIRQIEATFFLIKAKQGSYPKGFLIVDDNNYYRSMRNEFYQIAKKLQCSFCVLYLNCSVEEAVQRNAERSAELRIPAEAIGQMSQKLEEPNPMENPCDLFCVQVNSNYSAASSTSSTPDTNIDASVRALLQYSLLNPVVYVPPPDRSQDQRVCSENEVHQADLVLRKWITSQLTISSFTTNFNSSKNRRALSQELSLKKSIVLENLRRGKFKVTAQVTEDVEFREEIVKLICTVELPNAPEIVD